MAATWDPTTTTTATITTGSTITTALNSTDNSSTVPTTPTKSTPTDVGAQLPPNAIFGVNEELHPDSQWRKCWSKRENRHYFWNKSTGESLWEIPRHFDPLTDPLGIACSGAGANVSTKKIKKKINENNLNNKIVFRHLQLHHHIINCH